MSLLPKVREENESFSPIFQSISKQHIVTHDYFLLWNMFRVPKHMYLSHVSFQNEHSPHLFSEYILQVRNIPLQPGWYILFPINGVRRQKCTCMNIRKIQYCSPSPLVMILREGEGGKLPIQLLHGPLGKLCNTSRLITSSFSIIGTAGAGQQW